MEVATGQRGRGKKSAHHVMLFKFFKWRFPSLPVPPPVFPHPNPHFQWCREVLLFSKLAVWGVKTPVTSSSRTCWTRVSFHYLYFPPPLAHSPSLSPIPSLSPSIPSLFVCFNSSSDLFVYLGGLIQTVKEPNEPTLTKCNSPQLYRASPTGPSATRWHMEAATSSSPGISGHPTGCPTLTLPGFSSSMFSLPRRLPSSLERLLNGASS